MQFDEETCYRAMSSRDARFDGRFFTAVRTTGIYCRPVCPARTPLRENVEFHPSAAAAEEAGFRPCRRCRPDAAPGSPEWRGSSALLSRALRLIHAGALHRDPREDGPGGTVENLAEKLGLSARHLARLFREELGASPLAVAQTLRADVARELIDTTGLPMTEVAFGAGYGSLRRFNAAIKQRFGMAPRELRRRARGDRAGARRDAAGLCLQLTYRPPLDWDHLLAFLSLRAIPGVEVVQDGTYRRTVRMHARPGWIEVRRGRRPHTLELVTDLPAAHGIQDVAERARVLFDLRADPHTIAEHLGREPFLRRALLEAPGVRVPGAWDGFELAVRAIVGQQVTVQGAGTLLGRLARRCGQVLEDGPAGLEHVFPTPEEIATADLESLGLTGQRAQALAALAAAVLSGELDLEPSADPVQTRACLLALPGVGTWTADLIVMRGLCDPDAFPAGDLVLRRVAGAVNSPLDEGELERRSQAWSPWRAYAAVLLWRESSHDPPRQLDDECSATAAGYAGLSPGKNVPPAQDRSAGAPR